MVAEDNLDELSWSTGLRAKLPADYESSFGNYIFVMGIICIFSEFYLVVADILAAMTDAREDPSMNEPVEFQKDYFE